LTVPDSNGETKGSSATIYLQSGTLEFRWKSFVSRQLGRIDAGTYMPTLLLAVPDPYNLSGIHGKETPPLAEGFFIKAVIHGNQFENIVTLPPASLRDNNTVWIFNDDNTLSVRNVTLLRRERDRVLVTEGLLPGDEVITSSVSGAAEGMKLRRE